LRRLFILTALLYSAVAFAQESDITVTKTGPSQSAADTDVAYTVTVFNIGPDEAASVLLTDSIPSGMTFVSAAPAGCTTPNVGDTVGTISCTINNLAASASAVFTFTFHIPPATPPGTFFTNIANVSSQTDPSDENNSSSAVTSTPPPPQNDVAIIKSGPSAAGPDTDVVYTIMVSNGGSDAADATWTDTLPGTMTFVSLTQSGTPMSCTPGQTTTCTSASYPSGGSTTFTLTGHIPAGTAAGTTFTNTATISAPNDTSNENNSSQTILTVSTGDVSISKSTNQAVVTAGNDITYSLTLFNAGPNVATNANFSDTLPPNTTFVSLTQDTGPTASCTNPPVGQGGTVFCQIPTLGSGIGADFTLVIKTGNTSSVTNTAIANSDQFDTDQSDNSDSVTTPVTPSADLQVTKSGPAAVTAGNNITYNITLTNNGPTDASNVSLTDALPANTTFVSATQNSGPPFSCGESAGTVTCTIATFPAGATATFTFVFHVSAALPNGSTVTNTANVSSATADPDGNNNSSSTSATVAPTADLAVTKSGPSNVIIGTNVTYTVTITNNGPSNAANVTLSDPAPPNTTWVSATQMTGPPFNCVTVPASINCTIATLSAGASATFQFTLNVGANASGSLTNTATASSATADPNPANSSGSSTAAVGQAGGVPTLSMWALLLLAGALVWIAATRV